MWCYIFLNFIATWNYIANVLELFTNGAIPNWLACRQILRILLTLQLPWQRDYYLKVNFYITLFKLQPSPLTLFQMFSLTMVPWNLLNRYEQSMVSVLMHLIVYIKLRCAFKIQQSLYFMFPFYPWLIKAPASMNFMNSKRTIHKRS